MDASLYRRYRHDGGDAAFPGWESSEGLVSWENAPAPALVAKRLLEGVLKQRRSAAVRAGRSTTPRTGASASPRAAAYGLLLGSRRTPKVWYGLPFGAAVWASGYVVLPLLGVYEPIWKYDLETLAKDLQRAPRLRDRHRGRILNPDQRGRPMTAADMTAVRARPRAGATDRDRFIENGFLDVRDAQRARVDGAVLFAEIASPPMNLLGPELVRDLVSLIQGAEAETGARCSSSRAPIPTTSSPMST